MSLKNSDFNAGVFKFPEENSIFIVLYSETTYLITKKIK